MSALNQPLHRRPSILRTREGHRLYMTGDFSGRPTGNVAVDPFSWREEFMVEWEMPDSLKDRLPAFMKVQVFEWQSSGACVQTSMKIVDDLEATAWKRAYPDKRRGRRTTLGESGMSTRRGSGNLSPLTRSSPPASFSTSPPPASETRLLLRTTFSTNANGEQSMSVFLDTPPFTPEDGKASGTVSQLPSTAEIPESTDLSQLTNRLTSLGVQENKPVRHGYPKFDLCAWENFLVDFDAELYKLQKLDAVRFSQRTDAMTHLIRMEREKQKPEYMAIKAEYEAWWRSVLPKARACVKNAMEMDPPPLEDVQAHRAARGFPI